MHKQKIFPRWRGFNLLGMFISENSNQRSDWDSPGYFCEEDFKMIADFGFDFVRLPLSYRVWGKLENPFYISEEKLMPLDKAVEFGSRYGLHVNICMHRLPGYCINDDETETLKLWTSQEAIDASVHHWTEIAKRYKDIGASRLSFNVINEPDATVTCGQYHRVAQSVLNAVKEVSPQRQVILDGLRFGDLPPTETMLLEKSFGYSCRGYSPRGVTHYKAATQPNLPEPKWPGSIDGGGLYQSIWDRKKLDEYYGMWAALAENFGVGVHCGEMGCFNKTPHDITLSWMEDVLGSLKSHNIGYALWNLRGTFGILDSGRDDAEYVDCGGHKLDIKMLKLLQRY